MKKISDILPVILLGALGYAIFFYISFTTPVYKKSHNTKSPIELMIRQNKYDEFVKEFESNAEFFRNYSHDGVGLLERAVLFNKIEIGDFLLKHGCNPNRSFDFLNITPLMIAVHQWDVPFIRLLLLNGADPCLKTEKGKTLNGWADEYEEDLCILVKEYSPENASCICD
jgi:hypothetical protein